jgi:hypothetical protein
MYQFPHIEYFDSFKELMVGSHVLPPALAVLV